MSPIGRECFPTDAHRLRGLPYGGPELEDGHARPQQVELKSTSAITVAAPGTDTIDLTGAPPDNVVVVPYVVEVS
jgi:hypothetical protein